MKRLGVGHVIKCQTEPFQGRVGFPKTLVAAKIRQSRVNSDTGSGPDPQAIGLGNYASGRLNAHFPESRPTRRPSRCVGFDIIPCRVKIH